MKYDNETLMSYVDAMLQASEIIKEENPDFLVAPMTGSIPFIDAMSVVDKDFNASKVVYMPASSRIKDVSKVIREWYSNFLNENVKSPHMFPKVMGIDEVVSGNSVVRCFKEIDSSSQQKRKEITQTLTGKLYNPDDSLNALDEADTLTDNESSYEFGRMLRKVKNAEYRQNKDSAKNDSKIFVNLVKDNLAKRLVYKTIGIEDSKKSQRSSDYNDLKSSGRIHSVSIKDILTMDRPEYITAQFEHLPDATNLNHIIYSPIVKEFKVTPQYMDFLTNLANFVGRNSADVAPVNMNAILDSKKYLSQSDK